MKKGFVYLVGAGPGDPLLITLKGHMVLAQADCVIYDFLSNPEILQGLACERIYVGKKGSSHTLSQDEINELIVKKAQEGRVVVRLKGGDPYIFGRGGEEAEKLVEAGIPFAVVPGVSSFYAAPAYAGIPVTHRECAGSFEVITGHRKADASEDEDITFPEYSPDKTFCFLMGMKNLDYISGKLISEHNFPPDTPVAVISWGTMPEQRTVTGPLFSVSVEVEKAGLEHPAIIIMGSVVDLREKLRWYDTLPLFGKRIVVTRTRSQASRLSGLLSALGAGVMEIPAIEIKPAENTAPLDSVLAKLDEYSWCVFTSQNAVDIFFDRMRALGYDSRYLSGLKVAAIGPATADALAAQGICADMVPDEYVAESLLQGFKDKDIKDRKILLPCSSGARETLASGLEELGAEVNRIHIYDACEPELSGEDALEQIARADMVTFASSSSVRHFFSIAGDVKADIACIGPITAETVREHGKEPAVVAEEYTIPGLVKAIESFYGKEAR